jgi:uncharacterized protein (UPF0332 family)
MTPEAARLLQKARDSRQAAALLAGGQSFSSHSAVIAAFGREFAKTGVLHPSAASLHA